MRVRTVLELGAAVRERREHLGWSQQSLADAAGVTREWVVRFEGGKATVRLDRVFDVLTVLGLGVELATRTGGGEP
ncbi:MAG: type II toxin-antitoxin system Y4mF family antitoxin [Pseudolysinimonas sp.]|uniref:type II toxin-antitoxin system Y4mF family antitoxin n=1 Tax=Pseudolysinimonas sp. TaxID=2680009 RepID=UPI003C71A408